MEKKAHRWGWLVASMLGSTLIALSACSVDLPRYRDWDADLGDGGTVDSAPLIDMGPTACVASECASEVCDDAADACLDETKVIYVDTAGEASGTCTLAAPCNTMALGLAQVTGARKVIKVRPGIFDGQVAIASMTVTILADLVIFRAPSSSAASALVISSNADVTLVGSTITGTIGNGTVPGVSCANSTLRMRDAKVVANTGGGGVLLSTCEFSLVNNIIASNGVAAGSFGGVRIENTAAGMHEFAFNTVTLNGRQANDFVGVECSSVLATIRLSNNIVYENTAGATSQVGGDDDCMWTYSLIGPQAMTGTGNLSANPMFVDSANRDFHLLPTSPARNAADPATPAAYAVDFEGDPRPLDGRSDMGADEYAN